MRRRVRLLAATVAVLLVLPAVAWAAGDPYRIQQWSLDRIRADEAWEHSRGAGIVVAVIDTGIDLDHPDLVDRLLRDDTGEVIGHDLVDGERPVDRHGHGTLVAGVVAATAGNGEGIAGVAPEARIMPIKALDDQGAGRGRGVDAAIRGAGVHGADGRNLSRESGKAPDGTSPGPGAPTAAVRYAWEQGVVVVAAAGNGGAALSDYPPDSPVVLVGASDREDRRARFSGSGRTDAVLAPGVDIVSTWCRAPGADACDGRTHSYGLAEGTSFAAPQVAGAIALLLGAGIPPDQAVERLRATAVDLGPAGPDEGHGYGRIDVAAAIGVDGPVPASPARTTTSGDAGDGEVTAAQPRPATSPDAAPATPDDGVATPDPVASDPPMPDPPSSEPPPADPPGQAAVDEAPPDDGVVDEVTVPDPPQAVALPARGERSAPAIVLQLFAAALVGASLASWSAVARRLT